MSPHEELFHRLLDESSSLLATPESAGIAIPDDELHREIIVPLLPAMLADAAIRGHWSEQHATGFVARIGRHFENGDPAPRWTPADFEIHVTASYSAGPDARALADTLLSEESLRDMTAALMNRLLDALWPSLAPAPSAGSATEIETPVPPEPLVIEELTIAMEPQPEFPAVEPVRPAMSAPVAGLQPSEAIQIPPRPPCSHALMRSLCRKLAAPFVRRKLAAHEAGGANAAILARKILRRAKPLRKKAVSRNIAGETRTRTFLRRTAT